MPSRASADGLGSQLSPAPYVPDAHMQQDSRGVLEKKTAGTRRALFLPASLRRSRRLCYFFIISPEPKGLEAAVDRRSLPSMPATDLSSHGAFARLARAFVEIGAAEHLPVLPKVGASDLDSAVALASAAVAEVREAARLACRPKPAGRRRCGRRPGPTGTGGGHAKTPGDGYDPNAFELATGGRAGAPPGDGYDPNIRDGPA